jgi:hypothetical protein
MSDKISANEVDELRRLADKKPHFIEWVDALESKSVEFLTRLITELHTEMRGDHFTAYRESAKAVLEAKLTANLIDTLEKLNSSAVKLQKTGIAVMVIIGLATLVVTIL